MLCGRRYRLRLTAGHAVMCEEFGSICRAVWNTGLDQRRQYRRRGAWMNYVPQAAELADAKRDHSWLKAAPSHVLQQTLKDLDRACREHGTFKVRWRSKARWAPSLAFPRRESHHRGTCRPQMGSCEAAQAGMGYLPVVTPARR
ncbi:helix-turn-helix domain-containing protein [Streptomyces sp. NPDC002285]